MGHPIDQRKVVPFDEVRPLLVPVEPIAGESFLGFLQRALSRTAVTRTIIGLNLAGINKLKPSAMSTVLTSDKEIGALARLLGVTDADIRSRLLTSSPINDGVAGIKFHNITVRAKYHEPNFRRLSPRGLAISNHHRAVWNLRPFSFDPETLGELVDACPVCHHKLDWLRVYGVNHCNHCLDDDKLPTVDLRDYPGSVVETDDREALLFAHSLVSHDPDVVREVMARVPAPWCELTPSELFDAVMVCAGVLANNDEPAWGGWRPAKADLQLPSIMIATASRMILDGAAALAGLLRDLRTRNRQMQAHDSLFNEVGNFAYVKRDPGLSPKAKAIISAAIDRELEQRPYARKLRWDAVLQDGKVDLRHVANESGINFKRLLRLTKVGLVPSTLAGHRAKTVRVVPEDIRPALDQLALSATGAEVAQILNVAGGCVGLLAERGFILPAPEMAQVVLGPDPHHLRQSAVDLLERFIVRIPVGEKGLGSPLDEILESSGRHAGRWGAAMVAIMISEAPAVRSSPCLNWRHDVKVLMPGRLFDAMEQIESDAELVDSATAARLVGTSIPMIGRLVRAGHLPRMSRENAPCTRGDSFPRKQIAEFARKYILGQELLVAAGKTHSRLVRGHLQDFGVLPALEIDGRNDLVYLRSDIERVAQWPH
jgi:hypothetical protein